MNKRVMTGVLLACLFSGTILFTDSAAAVEDYTTWSKGMPITFSGYAPVGGGTLTNFPVLVLLSNTTAGLGFNYGDFLSPPYGDLRFSGRDRLTPLNFEVEKWDTNGISQVWVQIPFLSDTNTQIWMFWGRSASVAPPCVTNGAVWSSQYVGVWHLGETNGLAADATPYRNDGSVSTGGVNRGSLGMVDGAYAFSNPGALNCGSNASLNVGYATWEAWVFPTNLTITSDAVVGKGHNAAYWFGLAQNTGKVRLHCGGGAGNAPAHDSATAVPSNQWTHIMATWDGLRVRHYLNGVMNTNIAEATAARTNATRWAFLGAGYADGAGAGAATNLSFNFAGRLDEVRISSAPRGSNWVWATWMNTASNAAFTRYGASENAGRPIVLNSNVTGVTTAFATLNGNLIATGTVADTAVAVFWGTNDSVATMTEWGNTNTFPTPVTPGLFSTNVAISPALTYYYRFYATNAAGEAWATPAVSFGLPLVNNGSGATNVTYRSATLQGGVVAYPSAVAYVYWGAVDRGTNRALWKAQNEILIGPGTNWSFSTNVAMPPSLTTSITTSYYYRCFASNEFGEGWAPNTIMVTLLRPPGIFVWTNAAGGSFQDAANWSSNMVPDLLDTVIFNLTSQPYTVTWNASVTTAMFRVDAGTVTWNLQGYTYTYTNLAASAVGTTTNAAELTITNGNVLLSPTVGSPPRFYIRGTGTVLRLLANGKMTDCNYPSFSSGARILVDGTNALFDSLGYFSLLAGEIVTTNGGVMTANDGAALSPGASLQFSGNGSGRNYALALSSFSTSAVVRFANGASVNHTYIGGAPSTLLCAGRLTLDGARFFDAYTTTTFAVSAPSGILEGIGTMEFNYVRVAGGSIWPGGSNRVGQLLIKGGLSNASPASVIAMELGGTLTNQYDRLSVTNGNGNFAGIIYAGGTLNVSLINGFQPQKNNSFDILDFLAMSGTFSTVILPEDPARWNTNALYTTGVITYLGKPVGTVIMVR